MTGIAPSPTEHGTVKWFKSSYSGGEGNECVEVASGGSWVGVRDSKVPRQTLTFPSQVFSAFVDSLSKVRRDRFQP
ncbi:DUF397 domain-containing protein [Streptomyces sp. NPDC018026]|uniref:DUF397 domain-containing protein n=1 Tax=Streptomyces sp. NPDC018026 TaxID=3365031 RepID=UPI0037A10A6C